MKDYTTKIFVFSLLVFFQQAQAQEEIVDVDPALQEACMLDVGLVNYLFAEVKALPNPEPDYFDDEEKAQINKLIVNASAEGKESKEIIDTVIDACSQGKILQERNQSLLSN